MSGRHGLRMTLPQDTVDIQELTDDTAKWSGYALKWEEEAEIRDFFFSYTETFAPGAFNKTVRERGPNGNGAIKLLRQHNSRQAMAGKYTNLFEDNIGLRYEAETINTSVGQDLREELRAGTLHNMSIGFDSIEETYNKDENKYTVLEARLWEISPVLWGAYSSSTVENVREIPDIPAMLDRFYRALEQGRELRDEEIGQLTLIRARIGEILNADSSEPVTPLGQTPVGPEGSDHVKDLDLQLDMIERELGLT